MRLDSNKEKGNTGLGIAIAYYSANGYTVSIPLNDTQDYDLIVGKDNILKKVQVKVTSCKTKGETYKTVVDTNIDELFIVIDSLEMFKIPIKVIKNKSTLNLCEKYEKYNVLR